MNIEKQVINIIAKTVNDLINGKYTLISMDKHTATVVYGDNRLEIWTANGASSCSIYTSVGGIKFPEFESDEIKQKVFDLATTRTYKTVKFLLKKARKEQELSYHVYKDNVKKCHVLREELKTLLGK